MKSLNYYKTAFIKSAFGFLLLFLIMSCKNQNSTPIENLKSTSDIETEIKKEIEALYDFYTKSDLKWVDFYKDVYTVSARDGSFQTRYADSLRTEWKDIYNRYDVILIDRGEPTVIASGDQALHYNSFDEIFIEKATNDTIKNIGSWVVLWKKQNDDSWKIEFETYHLK